jgi:uncharacterized protein YcbK (DUF882 family)
MKGAKFHTNSRRSFLGAATGLVLTACPLAALARIRPEAGKSLKFYNLHTGERLAVDYWADGQYIESSLAEIDVILRDYRTGEVKPINRHLLDCLHLLQQNLEVVEDFHVISGYRSAKTNQTLAKKSGGVAKKSLHMRGMAIDIRVPGIQLTRLRTAAASLKIGGVGYYPKPDFVHVDVGRVRYW